MAGERGFQVEGLILEVLDNGTCSVELANGHRLRGFVAGKCRRAAIKLVPGQKVLLQLSPYDLSEGRILTQKR